MSAALDAILADIEAQLEVAVELDSAKRSDGTLKTWYYSTHGRSTGAAETPANTEFPAYLVPGGTLGPLSQSLAEDLLFAGMAAISSGSIILVQSLPESATDQLSQLNDYTFAGYGARIKIGRVADAYASFEIYRTTTCDVEPEVTLADDGLRAELRLAGALKRMLEENLIVNRYVGIPTAMTYLTGSGRASVPHLAAYNLTSYTLMGKFKVSAAQTFNQVLHRKGTGTNKNWSVFIGSTGGGFSGKMMFTASLAGVDTTMITSPSTYVDGDWHFWVAAIQDKSTAYLMVDGSVVGTYTPAASVDVQTAVIDLGVLNANPIGSIVDMRLYDRYIAPDEARSLAAVRSDGDDLGCVGLWRFDDNSGTVANDYSSNNNDATIVGTQNTDWKWNWSDLGEPELAGRPMPIVAGEALNAQAQLIDGARERYRAADGEIEHTGTYETTLTVRSRGTALTGGGTDYTAPAAAADGVIAMVAQEDEPVTFDLRNDGTNVQYFYPSFVGQALLTSRSRLTGGDVENQTPVSFLCPWLSGWFTDQDSTASQALADILGGAGLCYYEVAAGALRIDFLLPPMGYGPYGESCLDLRGALNGGADFGDVGDAAGSMTVACWVNTHLLDQTTYDYNVGNLNYLVAKANDFGNYALYLETTGANAGKLAFATAGTTVRSAAGILTAGAWYFVAAVFDDTANTSTLYVGPNGGSVVAVASTTNSGTPTTNTTALRIGGANYPWVAVQHAQVWTVAKNLAQLQALMNTPPVGNEANLVAYVPLNEGSGSPVEKVNTVTGALTGSAQWAPKLVVNLNDTPSVKPAEFRHVAPAADVIVRYARNRHPMTSADIDTGVSQNNRLDLMREWKDVSLQNADNRTRYKNSRRIQLDSPITDRESAQRLARSLMTRFGTDRYVGTLEFPSGLAISRQACGLAIGDELGIIGAIPSQLSTARSFRVVAVAPNPLQLSTKIAFWG